MTPEIRFCLNSELWYYNVLKWVDYKFKIYKSMLEGSVLVLLGVSKCWVPLSFQIFVFVSSFKLLSQFQNQLHRNSIAVLQSSLTSLIINSPIVFYSGLFISIKPFPDEKYKLCFILWIVSVLFYFI